MGLTTGPVPARVDANVKAGLLELIDHAEQHGWSRSRAAIRLVLDESRQRRWTQARRDGGDLLDAAPGENPLHGLLPAEREAIITVHDAWGEVDLSHRKLAHRGSRLGVVHVSESTVLRVLQQAGLTLPGAPRREPVPRTPFPDWLEWKPNRIWGYDYTHFPRARRAAVAVIDIVSRKWIATLVSAEETSTQVETVFCDALEAEDLLDAGWAHGSDDLKSALADGTGRPSTGSRPAETCPCSWPSRTMGHRCARCRPESSWPGSRSRNSSAVPALPPTKPGSKACSGM